MALRIWLGALLLAPSLLLASRLPIRTYTTADGLARDHILCIVQDSHGFLWFCTAEGLSRFDGYQFTNYRVEQGLPGNVVTGFLETREGVYWIATTKGVVRFDASGAGPSKFHRYPLQGVPAAAEPSVLYEDRAGGIWCGTRTAGLLRLDPKDASFHRADLRLADPSVTSLLVDRQGTLWVGSPEGLYRRGLDGTTKIYTTADGLPNSFIMALLEDSEGRLWIGTRIALVRMDSVQDPHQPRRMRVYTTRDGLPGTRIESLLESADRKLWAGTTQGLAQWIPSQAPDGHEFQSYTVEQGLSARSVGALAEDRDGNLWIDTFGSGAMKMARSGFTTYAEADGVPYPASLMESRQGEMCILSRSETGRLILRFDGRRFAPIRPAWPSRITYFGWGSGQVAVQDET
jgi:ligand-binding sensor domain-containing protein